MSDLDLSRRAVACRGWRWLRGSVTLEGLRVVSVDDRGRPSAFIGCNWDLTTWCNGNVERELRGELPDFRDPATRGCLLQLVREAWGEPYMYVNTVALPGPKLWAVFRPPRVWEGPPMSGPSEAAALVAALEAAPERK